MFRYDDSNEKMNQYIKSRATSTTLTNFINQCKKNKSGENMLTHFNTLSDKDKGMVKGKPYLKKCCPQCN